MTYLGISRNLSKLLYVKRRAKNHTEPRWNIYADGSWPWWDSASLRSFLQVHFKAEKRKGYLELLEWTSGVR